MSLQDTVIAELDKLVETNVIAPVTEPTQWVYSIMVVQKHNNKIRIFCTPETLITLYGEAISHCQQVNKWQHD